MSSLELTIDSYECSRVCGACSNSRDLTYVLEDDNILTSGGKKYRTSLQVQLPEANPFTGRREYRRAFGAQRIQER